MNQKKAKSLRRWTSAAAATLLCAGITATALAEGGFDDATADLRVALSGRYSTGTPNADGGVEEIVAYNPENQCAYAVNGQTGELEKIDLAALGSGAEKPLTLTSEKIPVKEILETEFADFTYGDMTSVAVSPLRAQLFVAVQAQGYTDAGKIAVFDLDGNYICAYDAGVQPDMILVNEESGLVLTANEGEPREGKNAADPQGSVTILDLQQQEAVTVDFTAFDAQREALADAGVVLRKGTQPSEDLEPEYIAVAGDRAFVSLQENNAVAVLDLTTRAFTGVYSVGLEDYSKTAIDIDKGDEQYAPKTYDNLFGIRMPDGIAAFEADGKTYIITANEGDSRSDWGEGDDSLENEIEGKESPNGDIVTDKKVVYFDASQYDGLDETKNYLFGGRSATVFEVTDNGLVEVFGTTNEFERITAEKLPDNFNCSNDDKSIEDRSGKKGTEPESVTTGTIDGRTYAFIALERIGGIMVYDVTSPAEAFYVNYVNTRDFSEDIAGDVAPEGLCFIPAQDSPTEAPMLLVANEVSGTVATYDLALQYADYSNVDAALAKIPADLDGYTPESVAALETAKNAVVRNLVKSEQETVDAYAEAIEAAVRGLQARQDGGEQIPDTGALDSLWALAAAALGLTGTGAALAVEKKRNVR